MKVHPTMLLKTKDDGNRYRGQATMFMKTQVVSTIGHDLYENKDGYQSSVLGGLLASGSGDFKNEKIGQTNLRSLLKSDT